MPLRVAIEFDPAWHNQKNAVVMGANSASGQLLDALLQHAQLAEVVGYVASKEHYLEFKERVQRIQPGLRCRGFSKLALEELAHCDVYFRSDVKLGPSAWERRLVAETGWSLCGLTHTLCSELALDSVQRLLLAPLHPWDAVVCTAQGAKRLISSVWDACRSVASEQGAVIPAPRLELPVIPLGVDCTGLAAIADNPALRAQRRRSLGIADDALAFLYFGRLSFHAKAHPLPMLLALQRTVERTGRSIHLLQVGWFPSPGLEKIIRSAAAEFCPRVHVHFLDGADPHALHAWAAADIFISLADNIQETFGLTPIEALAAGKPAIVSDWNGYRETIEHGVVGLRVPTIIPPSPAGEDLVRRMALKADDYDYYIASVSQATAVDVDAATEACVALTVNDALRKQMGQAARARAREVYDWPRIAAQYAALWEELSRRRQGATPKKTRGPAIPWLADPFATFAHYATVTLGAGVVLELTAQGLAAVNDPRQIEAALGHKLLRYIPAPENLLDAAAIQRLLQAFAAGPRPVEQAVALLLEYSQGRVWRTVGWLLKISWLRLTRSKNAVPAPN